MTRADAYVGRPAAGAIVRLLGAQVAIGAAAIFGRFALTGAGPIAVAALRLGIASLALAIVVRGIRRLGWRREVAFAMAGCALALHFATWFASLQYTSVAISTLLVTTTPLWTEVYAVVVERRPPSRAFVIALACASAGVALIVLPASAPAPIGGYAVLGAALALLGSVAIGAYLLVVRDAGGGGATARLPTGQIVLRTYGWATIVLAVAAACAREGPPAPDHRAAWGGILAMALVSQLLGHTLLNAALGSFAPSTVALATLLEPAIASLLAAWALGETLAPTTILGGLLVLAAVAVVLVRSNVAARTDPEPNL
ncbi:MAG: DMT family transporter [Vulcanimicrobiaceae bacterium]